MPNNILQSAELLGDACVSFEENCAIGIEPNHNVIKQLLNNSLMLVTALAPRIGYDNAAKIAKSAHKNGTTLKEEVIKSGTLTEKEYKKIMNPMLMTKPK